MKCGVKETSERQSWSQPERLCSQLPAFFFSALPPTTTKASGLWAECSTNLSASISQLQTLKTFKAEWHSRDWSLKYIYPKLWKSSLNFWFHSLHHIVFLRHIQPTVSHISIYDHLLIKTQITEQMNWGCVHRRLFSYCWRLNIFNSLIIILQYWMIQ